jgi:hypothetical protein
LAIDREFEDQRRLQGILGERIAYLEGQLIDEHKARRERWRVSATAILEISAAELSAMAPPIIWPKYMLQQRDGVFHMVAELFEQSRQRVPDDSAGLDFIRRATGRLPWQGEHLTARLRALTEFVSRIDLDTIYGPDGDYEEQEAA